MDTIEIKDRFNARKVWIVKRSKCGHYYVNQKIDGRIFYSKFTRTKLSNIEIVLNIKRGDLLSRIRSPIFPMLREVI